MYPLKTKKKGRVVETFVIYDKRLPFLKHIFCHDFALDILSHPSNLESLGLLQSWKAVTQATNRFVATFLSPLPGKPGF
jgi:hypothetical protein